MSVNDSLTDGLFDYIRGECDPLTGDCLSVASAFDRILPEGNIYALMDEHDNPTHFFYGFNCNIDGGVDDSDDISCGKFIDGNGIQSLDEIKSGFICDTVHKYDLTEEDPRYDYPHMVNEDLINDICYYNN